MSACHNAKSSLSKFLLSHLSAGNVAANNARIRTNARMATRELSFRDLDIHALVNETKIQAPTSPIPRHREA